MTIFREIWIAILMNIIRNFAENSVAARQNHNIVCCMVAELR